MATGPTGGDHSWFRAVPAGLCHAVTSRCPCWPRKIYGLGGPVRFHVLPGLCVGGRGESPGSIVTWRGSGTFPPLGPTSRYSPGRCGFSPGFWVATVYFPFWSVKELRSC